MHVTITRPAIIAAMGLALASCGSDPEEPVPEDDANAARGEVLGGTISDDMLPLDTLSEPPSAPSQGDDDVAPEPDADADGSE